jgi:hypothetical protein
LEIGTGALGGCVNTLAASLSETAGPALQPVYCIQHQRAALPEAIKKEFRWHAGT